MVQNSVIWMTAIDSLIIFMTGWAIIFFLRNIENFRASNAQMGALSILLGICISGIFYLSDLATMHIFPMFMPMAKAMSYMNYLHENVSWFMSALSISSILFGFLHVTRCLFLSSEKTEKTLAHMDQRETELAAQNERFNTALDNMSQGLCMFDSEQRLIVCNKHYPELYNLTSDLVKPGTTLAQIIQYRIDNGLYVGESVQDQVRQRQEWVSKGIPSSTIHDLSDGRSIELSYVPTNNGGWLTTHKDITESRQFERQLEKHAAMVDLMNSVSVAANESNDSRNTIEYCLSLICRFAGWNVGHVYKPAKDGTGKILPTGYWYFVGEGQYEPFREETERTVIERGKGLPGRVFEQMKPFWIYDVTADPNYPRARAANDSGLIGGVAFPVRIRDQVVAILEFYASHPLEPDLELTEILDHVCTQIGRVVERELSEKEKSAHRDHLQEMVDMATVDLRTKADVLNQALAKEKELNTLQRQFVSMASHEFRTPLAIIDMTAQRLKRRADSVTPEITIKRADEIRVAVLRMTRLMESMLSAARMEEGKVNVDIGPCDIGKVVREACERQQEIDANHVISCDLANLPETMQADPAALEQILTNLLSNAVKYAPDNPDIEVKAHMEGQEVVISVRDHGLGIDQEELSSVGERFFRAKTSTGIAGTGIGLNLVNSLVGMHDGLMNVESKKGEGSTFTVRLPVAGPEQLERADTRVA